MMTGLSSCTGVVGTVVCQVDGHNDRVFLSLCS